MTQDAPETPSDAKQLTELVLLQLMKPQTSLDPYRVIHEVEVSHSLKQEAMDWLQNRFGHRAIMAATAGEIIQNSNRAYSPEYLLRSNYIWDGYFSPATGRLIFQIKDHDQDVMLFKLTFGGK